MFLFDTYVQIVLGTDSTEQQSYDLSPPVLCYLMVKFNSIFNSIQF